VFFKKQFHITDADKEWVHETFDWLLKSYGYPVPGFTPILLTKEHFPQMIADPESPVEPLIADLCQLFGIDPNTISYEVEYDIRDNYGTPYEIQGAPYECDLEFIEKEEGSHYKLYMANSLLQNPSRLVFNTVFRFIQIELSQTNPLWMNTGDHNLYFYLIGIYKGWGVILAQTMTDTGRATDGFWETSWKHISPMPVPIMAYSMALLSGMIEEKDPGWKQFLPADTRSEFEKAIAFIDKNGNPFYNKQELAASALFSEAGLLYNERRWDESIELYQKALFLTSDDLVRSRIYNDLGYMHLCKNEFERSIPSFLKALELDPAASYANDNLGFAYIMIGDLDTGRHHLAIALQSGTNEHSYSYRNLALYHQKKGETELARVHFQRSFDSITFPVDWLEYYYARFLFEHGEKDEAIKYLQMAVDKGEELAIQWMNEINKTN
jgi:tetratricopeptide (TPR) repeat protein